MQGRKVLISGASGLIGSAIAASLEAQGWDVHRLVRKNTERPGDVLWNPYKKVAPEIVSGFDVVIHLAGENVFGIWTRAKKQRIRDSRNVSTRNLAEALAAARQKPQLFICASAVGYYGDREDEILDENSAPGTGFLAEGCIEWEAATLSAVEAGIATVNLRFGIVLSRSGGVLEKMVPAFRMGMGATIGNGRQWLSWIHMDDLTGAVEYIIDSSDNNSLRGPVNTVATNPVTNEQFSKMLAATLSRPAFLRVPAFVLRTAMGSAADEMLLASQRVMPTKLAASQYHFKFPDLKDALANLLRK